MATRRQIGLRDFHVCELTQDDNRGVNYELPTKLPGIISATMSVERSNDSYYSDDIAEETFSSVANITLEVEVSNLSPKERGLLLGQSFSNGGALSGKDDAPKEFGVMFRSKKTNGKFRYVSLFKGKFTEPEENYATEADSITAQTMTLTFTAIPLINNGTYKMIVDEDGEDVGQIAGGADVYFQQFFQEMRYELPA